MMCARSGPRSTCSTAVMPWSYFPKAPVSPADSVRRMSASATWPREADVLFCRSPSWEANTSRASEAWSTGRRLRFGSGSPSRLQPTMETPRRCRDALWSASRPCSRWIDGAYMDRVETSSMHRRVASADVTQPIGPRRARLPHGDVIRVLLDGPAAVAGLRAGDRVLAVNGLVPRDIIDVRLDATSEHVELDVERNGERIVIAVDKRVDEDLGVEFASAAFDRMKTCNNRCAFCFIGGLPPGLRRSLYIKDDDFR